MKKLSGRLDMPDITKGTPAKKTMRKTLVSRRDFIRRFAVAIGESTALSLALLCRLQKTERIDGNN
jgi:hypothetical protein